MNREERIKRMFYGWDEEKDIIREIQKCQRNWDLTKPPIHQELIDYFLWTAQNSPSKQHEGYYDLYYTNDRKVIEECSKYTSLGYCTRTAREDVEGCWSPDAYYCVS